MRKPIYLCRVTIPLLLSIVLAGCATDGRMERWGQCALIGGGTGGLLGAIESTGAAAGGAAAGALIGGLICAMTTGADSDRDGVANNRDLCSGTPEGIKVDSNGCPIDSDNDGVPDYLDKCPDTLPGVDVNEEGCPDSDNDGVADNRDKCPNTPEGAWVDDDGCPMDSDGDGVPDGIDQCPNTPADTPVDARGCALDISRDMGDIYFAFDRDQPDERARQTLDEIVRQFPNRESARLRLLGYTDITGDERYNEGLCLRRAENTRKYLVEQGIPESRIDVESGGIVLSPNSTREERARNRRVSIYLQ